MLSATMASIWDQTTVSFHRWHLSCARTHEYSAFSWLNISVRPLLTYKPFGPMRSSLNRRVSLTATARRLFSAQLFCPLQGISLLITLFAS